MTEHLTMNTIIHTAFRRDLDRLVGALETFPAGSRGRADQIVTTWRNFAHQLEQHHEDEETLFWPAFRELGVDESLMTELEGEHGAMIAALAGATDAMRAFGTDPSAANTTAAHASMVQLRDVLLAHLTHEERDLEPWTAEQLDTPPVKAAQKAVRKLHPAGTFLSWLDDDADPGTRAALRHEIPAPVVFVMTKLGGRRYRKEIASVWS
jgi:hypothetical protein